MQTAYSPWEGYRVMFNGSKGRLELQVIESSFRVPSGPKITGGMVHGTEALANAGGATITVHPLWAAPRDVPVVYEHAGHGGGDARMLSVIFGPRLKSGAGEEGEEVEGVDVQVFGVVIVDVGTAVAVVAVNDGGENGVVGWLLGTPMLRPVGLRIRTC